MNRFIRLDSNNVVFAVRYGSELIEGEIQSDIGDLGQIRQADGTFITPQPTLNDVKNTKIAEIRDSYNQTLASGFNATVNGTQYTFGWAAEDMTHMNGAQTAISKGFLTFPVLYADVHGSPVSIPDQATLDNIQSVATKFMMAQHQQSLNLVGQVQSATTTSAVNAITWTPATY